MELNCPQCAAHFNVPDGAIGPKGRKLKCAKCGHTWRQMPPDAETPAAAPTPAPAPTPEPDPPPAPPPPAADSEPVPMEMEPGNRKAQQAPAVDDDLPMDSDQPAADDDLDDPLAGLDFGTDSLGGDDDDLDDLGGGGASNDTDLDDLLTGDPEPIPDMFSRGDDDDDGAPAKKRGGKVLGVLLGLVLLLGLVGGGLYVARNEIVSTFPEAEPLYAALGIPVDALGVGLRFNEVTSERLVRDGTDTLVVRGFIANTSEKEREVPFLRLALFDATDALVQEMVAEPPQITLTEGATTGFRIQLENPSAAARRFEVDWTHPPPMAGQAGAN